MQPVKPVVLMSGCSSGVGMTLARECAARGCQVVATPRRIESIVSLVAENIARERLDVTDAGSVGGCAARTQDRFGRIDILVNNAGHLLVRLGPDSRRLPFFAAFPRRFVDRLLSGKFVLDRLS